MFKVGDKAVYPAHGVGVIEAVEHRDISGTTQSFYILRLLGNDMRVMVPTSKAESVGLRKIINKDKVARVYEILRDRKVEIEGQTWNRRYREYMDKIKTGSVFEVAEVLRDLCVLRHAKDLSFGERRMLDTARSLLVKELSIAKNMEEKQVEQDINNIFLH
jgi:CarD family transcriptional regulator